MFLAWPERGYLRLLRVWVRSRAPEGLEPKEEKRQVRNDSLHFSVSYPHAKHSQLVWCLVIMQNPKKQTLKG